MKRVLIIDNDNTLVGIWKESLECFGMFVALARTLAEGERIFFAEGPWDLVIMDGCVDQEKVFDSAPLTQKMRASFAGPMLASSSFGEYRKALMEAGCSHQADKQMIVGTAIGILGRETDKVAA